MTKLAKAVALLSLVVSTGARAETHCKLASDGSTFCLDDQPIANAMVGAHQFQAIVSFQATAKSDGAIGVMAVDCKARTYTLTDFSDGKVPTSARKAFTFDGSTPNGSLFVRFCATNEQ